MSPEVPSIIIYRRSTLSVFQCGLYFWKENLGLDDDWSIHFKSIDLKITTLRTYDFVTWNFNKYYLSVKDNEHLQNGWLSIKKSWGI